MRLAFPRLYAIMDATLLRISELSTAALLADAGVGLIQYRDKKISSGRLLSLSRELIGLCRSRGARFVVNDRADVAAFAGAECLHLGQSDLDVEAARRLCGASCWVGISTHTLEQVREADQSSADYLAVGPVFGTTTKRQADPVVGVDFVRQARKLTKKPVVAIGGLTVERAEEVYRAGADSLAVARDLVGAPDIAARAREYLEIAGRCFGESRN